MRDKFTLASYLIIGLIDLALGVIYFSADQFLSYHAQAVGTSWQEVDVRTQALILALMKVAGGGWLTLGGVTIALAINAFMTGNVLARWILPISVVIFYLGSFAATWSVFRETGAPTPWGFSLVAVGMALLALFVDAPWTAGRREHD